MSVCTVPKMQNMREGVWWEQGVTVGHQSQIWSLPASWQCFSPWLMFSDDNIWPLKLWLFLAALNGNHCRISSVGLISCTLTQPQSLSHFICFLLLLEELPMFCISHKTLVHWTYCSSLSKANRWFGGRWGIPEVVFIPNGQGLLHQTVGREGVGVLVGMPGKLAAKHHVAVLPSEPMQIHMHKQTRHFKLPRFVGTVVQHIDTNKSKNACVQEPKSLVSCIISTDG